MVEGPADRRLGVRRLVDQAERDLHEETVAARQPPFDSAEHVHAEVRARLVVAEAHLDVRLKPDVTRKVPEVRAGAEVDLIRIGREPDAWPAGPGKMRYNELRGEDRIAEALDLLGEAAGGAHGPGLEMAMVAYEHVRRN